MLGTFMVDSVAGAGFGPVSGAHRRRKFVVRPPPVGVTWNSVKFFAFCP
jgi:hypothetical protein